MPEETPVEPSGDDTPDVAPALEAPDADAASPDATVERALTVHEPIARDADSVWLKLKDTVGVSANGNLEPLVEIGCSVAVPTMVEVEGKLELAEAVQTLVIGHAPELGTRAARFIEGGRIIEVRDARVVDVLKATNNWDEIDAPTKRDIASHVKALTDATQEAANRSDEER